VYLRPVNDPSPADKAKGGNSRSGLWVGLLVLFGLLAFGTFRWLGPEMQAARGEGTHGTLTIETRQCGRGNCYYSGEFISADGRLRAANVKTNDIIDTGHETQVGDHVAVIYAGRRTYAENSTEWVRSILLFITVSIMITGVVIWYWRSSRRP